jgi:hypothetical protein
MTVAHDHNKSRRATELHDYVSVELVTPGAFI